MKKFIAEFIGTFSLVLFGCGSAVIAGTPSGPLSGLGLLGVSFAFGLAVLVMIYAIGPISGCHINPAITISMLVVGKLNLKDSILYIVSQCLGAITAAAVIYYISIGQSEFNGLGEYALGANGWGKSYLGGYNMTSAFIAEAVLTFLFLFVIFGTTEKNASPAMAGLAIGLTLTLIHMFAIPITGTSVNPARSLGPAVFAGGAALSQLWLFIVAPVIGGIVAALVWKGIFAPQKIEL